MPRELILIRHAQAWCNIEDIVGGPLGCRGLTPHGRIQANLLAARLQQARPDGDLRADAIYSSPRLRATQTAEPIADALELPVRICRELREQDLGDADGWSRSLLHATFEGNPVLEPWREPAVGAESWVVYVDRIRRALDDLTRENEGRTLVVVTHGEAINATHHVHLGLPARWPGPLPLTIANAAVTRWREEPWDDHRPSLGVRWNLQAHNDTAHLTTTCPRTGLQSVAGENRTSNDAGTSHFRPC